MRKGDDCGRERDGDKHTHTRGCESLNALTLKQKETEGD